MELRLNVKEEFWKNFNLSVIIPFYKKMEEFRRVFPLTGNTLKEMALK